MSDACACGSTDFHFSRIVCPEPCGSMHDVCDECGVPQDCVFEQECAH